MEETVTLNGKGRISIPGDIRNELVLEPGTKLLIEVRDDSIILTRLDQHESPSAEKEVDELAQLLGSVSRSAEQTNQELRRMQDENE